LITIRNREQLIDYCLRRLGHPVIEINVDEDQISDRIDDALQFYAEYTTDGSERVYLKYQVTSADISNGYITLSASGATGSINADVLQQTPTEAGKTTPVPLEDTLISVRDLFHFSASSINMFDVRYQYVLNDLYTMGSINLQHYYITQEYLSLLRQMLSPDKQIRFNRRGNRLYIDTKWSRELQVGDYLIIEAYRINDATVYPEIYDDILLKQYATALIKRQWGANMSKFNNVQLPGGIMIEGDKLYLQAEQEILKLEAEVRSKWEYPPFFEIG